MRLNTYAADRTGYQHLLGWNQHLADGPLDHGLRALVEIRVSQINGCAFCLAMHADQAREGGIPQAKLDTVAAWRDDPSFSARERAALALAESMTRIADGGHVGDDVWARAAGSFADEELAALVQVIAIINAFNRINVATGRTAEAYRAMRPSPTTTG
jgi:AhpD family alkylhydroperoxidase